MRGIALAIVGFAVSVFGGALYIASALKASSSGDDMWSVPLFVVGVAVAVVGAVLSDLDWRRERESAQADRSPPRPPVDV
jgi:hypothetical protein